MNNRWTWLAVAALLAIALVGAACGDDDDDATGDDATADGVNEISMSMSDELSFDPDRMEV
jgi:hypothetical protein